MLYSRWEERDVVIRAAREPEGPWTAPRTVYRCGESRPDRECYAAKEHAGFAREGGRRTYFTLVDGARSFGGVPELFELAFGAPTFP